MDTSRCIQTCNPSRFVITFSLLIFAILFALRLDEHIIVSYWLVFLPLFIWKILVIFGGCIGVILWHRNNEQSRIIRTSDNDRQALTIYSLIHILIFIFELLTCDKLENHRKIPWIVCFSPLPMCTIVSFGSCLWSLKLQRNFLIQGFISINGLFFLLFPFRLDYFITWRYVIVFIPVWISLCIGLLFVIGKLILAFIHRYSHRILAMYRESSSITEAVTYAILFIPFGIFSILLVDRLDHEDNNHNEKLSFTLITIPLWITLFAWLTFSFGANDANPWWFGLRRNLCEIILDRCSCISIYCNNQFKSESHLSRNDSLLDITTSTASQNIQSMSIQKLSIIKNKNENILTKQFNNTSLLEPD